MACIATMARIICTLSRVPAIGGSLFFARQEAATASFPCWNKLGSATASWWSVTFVMPEHIHLLISEPEVGTPSTVMQVLKQRTAGALLPKTKRRDPRQIELFGETPERTPFWQGRFNDFNVWTNKKRVEKLRYMHRNPVKRGLAAEPEDWRWSSYRFYSLDEAGRVRVNEGWGRISFEARTA